MLNAGVHVEVETVFCHEYPRHAKKLNLWCPFCEDFVWHAFYLSDGVFNFLVSGIQDLT